MSSLTDRRELIGFFSYSREDDEDAEGALSKLRDRIQRELGSQLGRPRGDLRLWQDKAAIPVGTFWEKEINSAIAESAFFIPIVTPRAVRSRHCAFEFEAFLAREAELGRDDLVFPILYIPVPELEQENLWRADPVLKIVGSRHYLDWRDLRHLDVGSADARIQIQRFCGNVSSALRKRWMTPDEQERAQEEELRRKALEADAKARAEAEARAETRAKADAKAKTNAEVGHRAEAAPPSQRSTAEVPAGAATRQEQPGSRQSTPQRPTMPPVVEKPSGKPGIPEGLIPALMIAAGLFFTGGNALFDLFRVRSADDLAASRTWDFFWHYGIWSTMFVLGCAMLYAQFQQRK